MFLSGVASELGAVLGQLLDAVGDVVTIAAMGCQTKIITKS
jgi:predicted transposase YbfD/YdcC